jgi:hypothetical protein
MRQRCTEVFERLKETSGHNETVSPTHPSSESSSSSVDLSDYFEISEKLLEPSDSSGTENESSGSDSEVDVSSAVVNLKTPQSSPQIPRKRAVPKKKFTCPICNKHLGSKLRCHIEAVHYNLKKFVCDLCFYPFYYKYDLKRHLLRHFLSPSFIPRKVPTKRESFISPYFIRTPFYTEIHRNFGCSIGSCRKHFASISQLRKHQNITHSENRPFECCFCSKSFKIKSNLTRHIREVHRCQIQVISEGRN